MSSPPRRWMPRVPKPLERLFDRFPLVTYEANKLPARAPTSDSLPTLFVFASEEDASRDAPSYNPTCLKWQAFLKIAGVPFRIVSSTNHASPTGALPFLLPAHGDDTSPVPAHKLHAYALAHGSSVTSEPAVDDDFQDPKLLVGAYTALLDGPIRRAWLHALYLDPAHAAALARLYIFPSSRTRPVRAAVAHQLRRAAAADVFPLPSSPADVRRLYTEAAEAFAALETRLAESSTNWFFGQARPGLIDAAVFAYVRLMVVDGRVAWTLERGGKSRARSMMGDMVARLSISLLLKHHDRLLRAFWPTLAGSDARAAYEQAHLTHMSGALAVSDSVEVINMTESLLRQGSASAWRASDWDSSSVSTPSHP